MYSATIDREKQIVNLYGRKDEGEEKVGKERGTY